MDLPQEPVYRSLLVLLQGRNIPAGSCELSLHAFPFKSLGTPGRHSCQWNGICSSLLPAPHLAYITELIGLWPVWDSFRTSQFFRTPSWKLARCFLATRLNIEPAIPPVSPHNSLRMRAEGTTFCRVTPSRTSQLDHTHSNTEVCRTIYG